MKTLVKNGAKFTVLKPGNVQFFCKRSTLPYPAFYTSSSCSASALNPWMAEGSGGISGRGDRWNMSSFPEVASPYSSTFMDCPSHPRYPYECLGYRNCARRRNWTTLPLNCKGILHARALRRVASMQLIQYCANSISFSFRKGSVHIRTTYLSDLTFEFRPLLFINHLLLNGIDGPDLYVTCTNTFHRL